MECIYCNNKKVYYLSDGLIKCAKCKRKFSPKKVQRKKLIKDYFIKGYSATKCAKILNMHYNTVNSYYTKFRQNLVKELEISYQQNADQIDGYKEHIYLPKTLNLEENINKIEHILTFSYKNRVYNILMPKIARLNYILDELNSKEVLEYLNYHKINKISTADKTINSFWEYFNDFVAKFKGIKEENFFLYLKEAEWRFNNKIF